MVFCVFPLEHGDLLSKGEDFESGVAAIAQEHAGLPPALRG